MRFVSIPRVLSAVVVLAALGWSAPAAAQVAPCPKPANLPPANSPVLLRCMQLVAHPVNETIVEGATYDSHIRTPRTDSAKNSWAAYNEDVIQADFWNLWNTKFLDNLWIEVIDEPYENGVMGKHVIFHIEERARLKVVDYVPAVGTKMKVEISKIEEAMKENKVELRLDQFIDETQIRRVKGIIRELHAEKGYTDAKISTSMTEMPAGPKLVHLTFTIDEGPEFKIRAVQFDGNQAYSDGKLRDQMKENKPKNWLSFITDSGTYQEAKYSEDADLIQQFYRNNGYVAAQIGQPQIETVETSKDGKTKWIQLRIPVDEGPRYRVGTFNIADNTAIRTEFLRSLFKMEEGEFYNEKRLRKGIEKTKEIYGTIGYWQWAPDVDILPRGVDPETRKPLGPEPPPPIVDVTVKMVEGKQFFVNRITFLGNTTTHDSVIRRELRVAEAGVFNSEALKDSVRRLNQLGYFKPLEGKEGELDVAPTPGTDNKVDIKIKFEEQNRNQLAFGAGVSQFDGFFGQLSFQTSNFLGRGETLGVSLQKGSQARQYQVSFSEPYLFDRPITAGVDLFSRQYIFPLQYTQDTTGTNTVFGFPLGSGYTRMFLGYSYQRIHVYDINPLYLDPAVIAQSPYLRESLLLDYGGRRTVSKVSPSVMFNTVNAPIFPSSGTKYTASLDIAGVGGNTQYLQTRLEGIWYKSLTPRMSFGLRAESQYIRPYGATTALPIFEKFFLGGEYSVRGFDIRSIGPRDTVNQSIVTGGNKTMLFNAEYYINPGGPVRILGFFDAGQVKDIGQSFTWYDPLTELQPVPQPLLTDAFSSPFLLTPPGMDLTPKYITTGKTHAFKTSTGLEVRFFMPVLNVPFRLIAAYNPSRRGVLNNNLQPTPKFTFRFAVGTTF
jgi:outer membrane protein insertion porin family